MLDREPFEPFRIVLASGDEFEVGDPHLVALLKSGVFVAAPDSDRRTFIPYQHVLSVETIGNGRTTRSGRGRKRRE